MSRRSQWVRGLAAVASMAMVAAFLTGAMRPPAYKGRLWVPPGHHVPKEKSVPGYSLPASAGKAARAAGLRSLPKEPGEVPSVPYRRPARIAWPACTGTASIAQVRTVRRGRLTGLETVWATRRQRAGSLPVTVSAAKPAGVAAGAASVRVTVAGQRATARAGIHGLMLTVSGRGALAPGGSVTGGLVTGGSATVRLSYKGFAKAYGGSWDSRLYLAEVPACALTTPAAPGCGARYQVPGGNDPKTDTLWARVRLNAPDLVLATETSPGGSDGTYAATSLSPSANWAVQDGDFTYNYPITVPPSLGGWRRRCRCTMTPSRSTARPRARTRRAG